MYWWWEGQQSFQSKVCRFFSQEIACHHDLGIYQRKRPSRYSHDASRKNHQRWRLPWYFAIKSSHVARPASKWLSDAPWGSLPHSKAYEGLVGPSAYSSSHSMARIISGFESYRTLLGGAKTPSVSHASHIFDKSKKSIVKAWCKITPEFCCKLIDSMLRRIASVIEAKGRITKYWKYWNHLHSYSVKRNKDIYLEKLRCSGFVSKRRDLTYFHYNKIFQK